MADEHHCSCCWKTGMASMAEGFRQAEQASRELAERIKSIAAEYGITTEEAATILGKSIVQRHIENGGQMATLSDPPDAR